MTTDVHEVAEEVVLQLAHPDLDPHRSVIAPVAPAPLLCISPYFESRRIDYYGALQGVNERGDVDQWLDFSWTPSPARPTMPSSGRSA